MHLESHQSPVAKLLTRPRGKPVWLLLQYPDTTVYTPTSQLNLSLCVLTKHSYRCPYLKDEVTINCYLIHCKYWTHSIHTGINGMHVHHILMPSPLRTHSLSLSHTHTHTFLPYCVPSSCPGHCHDTEHQDTETHDHDDNDSACDSSHKHC